MSIASPLKACVVALHCSLGSGRQWTRLAAELGAHTRLIAPDLAGYGNNRGSFDLPQTLAAEVDALGGVIGEAQGPIHLVGHSYGGAVAFKLAAASRFAGRVRSLTLIEPVLPTLLRDGIADHRLHDRFERVTQEVARDLRDGLALEAIDRFQAFWNGSGPQEPMSPGARLRMIEQADKLVYDFAAAFAEENVAASAAAIRVPTLLLSGGLSPYLTQRIATRLARAIEGAAIRHWPTAGHMLPITHAAEVNAAIVRHIAQADDRAGAVRALAAG